MDRIDVNKMVEAIGSRSPDTMDIMCMRGSLQEISRNLERIANALEKGDRNE